MSLMRQGGGRTSVCETGLNSLRSGSSWETFRLCSTFYINPSIPEPPRLLGQRFRAACRSRSVISGKQRDTIFWSRGGAAACARCGRENWTRGLSDPSNLVGEQLHQCPFSDSQVYGDRKQGKLAGAGRHQQGIKETSGSTRFPTQAHVRAQGLPALPPTLPCRPPVLRRVLWVLASDSFPLYLVAAGPKPKQLHILGVP